MEVHRHHSSHGSGWKANLKEFFMLFLAVLCGFFAEMKVHSVVEHEYEEEYISSIVEDITSDIQQINILLPDYENQVRQMDTLIDVLASPEVLSDSRIAYRLWTDIQGFQDFSYDDRTIQQLKNGAGLRLIRKNVVATAIMRYDQSIRKFQLQRNIMNTEVINQRFYFNLFDFATLRKSMESAVPLTASGKAFLNHAIGDRLFYKKSFLAMMDRLKEANIQARKTLEIIKKNYDIE